VIIMSWKSIFAIAAAGATCLAQLPVQLKVVKGSPFSAQAVTQSTQELAEGNRIVHQTTALIARDSDGRTRRENSSVVFIQDPAAGLMYVLEPNARVARRMEVPQSETAQPLAAPGSVGASDLKTESLGSQLIEGFVAQGTRLTRMFPAGQTGNERPLEIVSEAWYSDELQTLLMSKNVDPRVGEITFKLTDIQRGEPSHALFEVPGDYTIRDEPAALDPRSAEKPKNK